MKKPIKYTEDIESRIDQYNIRVLSNKGHSWTCAINMIIWGYGCECSVCGNKQKEGNDEAETL